MIWIKKKIFKIMIRNNKTKVSNKKTKKKNKNNDKYIYYICF